MKPFRRGDVSEIESLKCDNRKVRHLEVVFACKTAGFTSGRVSLLSNFTNLTRRVKEEPFGIAFPGPGRFFGSSASNMSLRGNNIYWPRIQSARCFLSGWICLCRRLSTAPAFQAFQVSPNTFKVIMHRLCRRHGIPVPPPETLEKRGGREGRHEKNASTYGQQDKGRTMRKSMVLNESIPATRAELAAGKLGQQPHRRPWDCAARSQNKSCASVLFHLE